MLAVPTFDLSSDKIPLQKSALSKYSYVKKCPPKILYSQKRSLVVVFFLQKILSSFQKSSPHIDWDNINENRIPLSKFFGRKP